MIAVQTDQISQQSLVALLGVLSLAVLVQFLPSAWWSQLLPPFDKPLSCPAALLTAPSLNSGMPLFFKT